ncbi:MAG TPA: hypothetical protein VG602_08755 [Actinomycetota bacterium]|nr:hypothetical protein [Actinomycetota bacterium]
MQEKRHRKIWGVFVACTMVGSLTLLATPTSAHTPPDNNANFHPDEHNGDGSAGFAAHGPDVAGGESKEAEILSDAEDGFGEAEELRAVADGQTAFYEWYDCANQANPFATGAAGGQCAPIATDTAGDPAPTPPGEGQALAFSGTYNIPTTSQTNNNRDIWGIACASDARAGGPPADASHCIPDDVVQPNTEGTCAPGVTPAVTPCIANVHMDDSSSTTDHAVTTDGRIAAVVTTSRTFTGDDVHGAGLKIGENTTFIVFTTAGGADAVGICMDVQSDDETPNNENPGAGVGGCTHNGTDTSPTPGGGTGCHASAPVAPGGDCWAISVGVPNANNHWGASAIEFNDQLNAEGITTGTGDCRGDVTAGAGGEGDNCQLDKILLSTTSAGEAAVQPPPPPPPPPPPGGRRVRTGLCDRNRPNANRSEILIGTRGPDQICGFGGRDTLRGRGGPDTLRGGGGKDVLAGGGGRDNARGGGGSDSLRGGKKADTLKGGGGKDSARGGPGDDLCAAEKEKSC